MGKRDPKTDVPRRIYKSTIDRIDEYLEQNPRQTKTGKRKSVKGDFNKFLIMLLDTYENIQNAPIYYTNHLHEDIEEARGEAVMIATKKKIKIKPSKMVMIMGEDEL